ncbi:MAG: hypothetical protein HYS35_02190 [Betaproteobacteria bacterium]|nr:hypothetical protein [Betaproteobacteria bacterium]
MTSRGQPALPWIAVGALTLAFALACATFVRQTTLATFADDSVSYLVMAQVFSPFQPASPAVASAFARETSYPPLFPLILALAGAAHDLARAHVLTALILAASVPLVYGLGVRWLESRGAAAAASLSVVLLPTVWINAKGILSEPLFCALLLATLHVLDSSAAGWRRQLMLALLLCAMALTRTAALPLIAVYAIWAAMQRAQSAAARAQALIPALAAAGAYAAWVLLRPAESADSYARIVAEHARALLGSEAPLTALGASLLRQMNAVTEGWVGSLLIFWVEGRPVRAVLAGVVGCLALAGMALRLRAGKADAWIAAAYLAMFLAWPFYDQMGRFLFPIVPVLILYAFLAAGRALQAARRAPGFGHALLTLLMLSLTLPALAFIQQRARAGAPFAAITDWYRTPDLVAARARAQVQLDLFADMEAIRALTRPADRVMWVAPSYVALLADRRGVAAPASGLAPEAYRRAVRESGADYVFLSRYHPRDTLSDAAWQAGARALANRGATVHARATPGSAATSLLLKAEQ